MAQQSDSRSWILTGTSVVSALALSVGLAGNEGLWITLLPSLSALLVVFLSRRAWVGLLTGALCGAVLISDALPYVLPTVLEDQFLPIFASPWKVSAVLFTLILGGFVALLEAGGGLQAALRRVLGESRGGAKRMQWTVMGFGLFVFFDGLANSMLIGRSLRGAADRAGVSREKLAYLADTTSSAVACLAFVSTWIAFQLSMIQSGFEVVGREVNAYALFFRSIPTNFYCWFALAMAVVCIARGYNPGPMGRVERMARRSFPALEERDEEAALTEGHWLHALVPVLVLTFSIPVIAYVLGAEGLWPFSLRKFAAAYAAAESSVPQILVASSMLASAVAAVPVLRARGAAQVWRVFFRGVRDLLAPVGILIAAWMLGSAIAALGAADQISGILTGRFPPTALPAAVFVTGALISFSTGTSWGTMGVLMPLTIPVVLSLGGVPGGVDADALVVAAIGAVFSGAVFGDHCSPFSDTTIVSSIAAGVEPVDHVRTQLPFALITALAAVVLGFVPLGYGVPSWLCLMAGVAALSALPLLRRRDQSTRESG